MADNFIDTAERMNVSCKMLHGASQFHNAFYFAGYVVECYLKLLAYSGSRRSWGHDIIKMNEDLQYAVSSAATSAIFRKYVLDIAADCPIIHTNWNPVKRYEDKANHWDNIKSNLAQIEQEKCFEKIAEMVVDSFI